MGGDLISCPPIGEVFEKAMRTKKAILAASSLLAAAAALSTASASDYSNSHGVAIEATVAAAPEASAPLSHADEQSGLTARQWAFLGIAAGALAGFVKLIGARKAAKAVVRAAGGAARTAANAAGGAVNAIGKAAGAPLKLAGLLIGLGAFILLGVGLYDVEWLAGLAVGALAVLGGLFGVRRIRRAWRSVSAALPFSSVMANGN